MSDHLPMWIELRVDFSREYLESLSTGASGSDHRAGERSHHAAR
jgi:hypothetical protein